MANQDPLSGCIGAVIGEIIGEAYADAHMKELLGLDPNRNVNTNLQMQNQGLLDPAIREKAVEKGLYLSKSGAALAAMLLKQNPTGAVESADISVRNNAALLLIPLLVEGTIIVGGLGLAALATYHIKKAADNGDFRKAATKLIAMGEVLIDSASEQISFLFQGKAYPTMKAVVGAYLIAHNLPFSAFSGSNSLVDPNRNEPTEKGGTTSKHAPSETKGNNGDSQDNKDEGHNGNNGGNGKGPKNPPPPVKKHSSNRNEKEMEKGDNLSKKSVIKKAGLPTVGKIRFVSDSRGKLKRTSEGGYIDKYNNVWVKGPSRTRDEAFEWDVQLSREGESSLGWASRDGKHVNVSLKGRITHE